MTGRRRADRNMRPSANGAIGSVFIWIDVRPRRFRSAVPAVRIAPDE